MKNFFYIDHGYFKQSKRKFIKNKVHKIDLDGYFRIVFKREDVNCILWDNGGSYPHTCRANGVKTDLTGRKSVYSDSETCPDDDYITCIVAEKFELF